MLCTMNTLSRMDFCNQIKKDFDELKVEYPFADLFFPKESTIFTAAIRVIAVCADIIDAVNGTKEDFTKDYSKLIYVFVSNNYQNEGCTVFGCNWMNLSILHEEDCHFNSRKKTPFGYELCVGTPESFAYCNNVVLECTKTADNMLIAYEQLLKGESNRLNLRSFSHGIKGQREFLQSVGRI